MLKRVSKNTTLLSEYKESIELISIILRIYDETFNTIYYNEFYYIYVTNEKLSIEEISDIVGVSETTLKDHIKKINVAVFNVLKFKKDIESMFKYKHHTHI